jgi:hypothetical protein
MLRDVILGILALGAAAAYYAAASAIPRSGLSDAIGAGGLPTAYAIVLAALAIVLIVRSSIAARQPVHGRPASRASRPQAVAGPTTVRRGLSRAILMLAIGIAYVLLAARAGYVVGLAGLILASIYAQRSDLRFRDAALVAISGAVVFWIVFVGLLGIPQPAGFWPSLL